MALIGSEPKQVSPDYGGSAWGILKALANNRIGPYLVAGAPVSGASGTYANVADHGALLVDITNAILYINTGTLASPTWTSAGAVGLALANADIFVGNASNIATPVAVSGDATLSNTGALTIAAGAITSAKVASSLIQTVVLPLTNAQIKALRATPVTVVAAPGVGKYINPIDCVIELIFGTSAFTANVGDNLALKWKDGTTTPILQGGIQAFIQQTASAFNAFVGPATGSDINVLKTNVDNQPLVIHNIGAAEIAGNAGSDNTMNLVVKYSVETSL